MVREIGPLFGRLESDYTAPMVERAFNIMLRAGAFGDVPPILAGREVEFEYASPVRRTRQLIERQAAQMFRNEVFELQNAGFSEARDHFNMDEYVRLQAVYGGAPLKVLNSPKVVQQLREQRAQIQAQEDQAIKAQQEVLMADQMMNTVKGLGGKEGLKGLLGKKDDSFEGLSEEGGLDELAT